MSTWSNMAGGLGMSSAFNLFNNLLSGGVNQLFAGLGAKREWKYKKKEMALEQDYNKGNMAIQNQYAIDAFNRENEYNSPAAQRARLEAAGINKNAIAGIGGSTNSIDSVVSSQSPASSGTYGGNTSSSVNIGNGIDVARGLQDVKESEARSDYYKALADRTRGMESRDNTMFPLLLDIKHNEKVSGEYKNVIAKIESEYYAFDKAVDYDIKLQKLAEIGASIREAESRIGKNEEEMLYTRTLRENYHKVMDNLVSDTNLKRAQTAGEWYKVNDLMPAEKDKISADTDVARARARKVDAEIEKIGKDMDLTDEKIKNLKNDRARAWAEFGVNTALSISREARSWITFGLSRGASNVSSPRRYYSGYYREYDYF